MKPQGIVLYRGPSQIDGKPVIAIATGITDKSENSKTGDMVQVWIIRRDIAPILAKRIGDDKGICGDCKHRDFGTCYVNLGHGPNQVYNCFHRDNYVDYTPDMIKYFKDKVLRIGAYGDPVAVPVDIWNMLTPFVKAFTSYTHQWRICNPKYKKFCMASIETEKEYDKAQEMGWRTFRVRLEDEPIFENEIICPASEEGGKKTTCTNCRLCNGSGDKKSVSIIFHGNGLSDYKIKRYIKGIKALKNKKKWRVDFDERWERAKELMKI